MTDIEFMKEKNIIFREELGLEFDLIPESQMVNFNDSDRRTVLKHLNAYSSSESCPYCIIYVSTRRYGYLPCEGCPIDKEGNNCLNNDSTWMKYINNHREITIEPEKNKRIKDLIEKYKKENYDKRRRGRFLPIKDKQDLF